MAQLGYAPRASSNTDLDLSHAPGGRMSSAEIAGSRSDGTITVKTASNAELPHICLRTAKVSWEQIPIYRHWPIIR
jgi:hypothetical protein